MCKCPRCDQTLFKLISYADSEYDKYFSDSEINHEYKVISDCHNIDLFVELDESTESRQKWCNTCNEMFIFCCGETPVIKSCCCSVYDGWYTFKDNKFSKHPKDEWHYDYLDKDSNIDIECLQITDLNDVRLSHLDITGPDGGCPFSVKCQKCGSVMWFSDK